MASDTAPNPTLLSLRPTHNQDAQAEPLSLLIDRIYQDRGGLRNLTEESLQKEIDRERNNASDALNEATTDGEEEGDVEQPQDLESRLKEIHEARTDMLAAIAQAENKVKNALDFVSLLLRKDAPTLCDHSLSSELKTLMPRGTLGFDRLEQPMPPRYDAEESRRIARGWNINKLDRAARRLKAHEDVANTNATGEETFWKDLSDISDDGWTTMRIPGEPHVMGVRLGSLESGPEFSQQSMARLDTDSSGHIVLNHPLARSPKFIRVTLKRGSTIVKTSELPSCLVPGHSPLKLFLRQARLSLCDQELFQTIREEARGLLRFHVQNESGKITFPIHTPSGGTKDGSNALTWYAIIEFENPDGNSSEAEQHDVSYDQDFEGTDPASQMVELLRNGLLRLYELRFRARTRPPRPMSLDHANSHNEPPKAPILRSVVEKMRHSCILQYLRGHLQLLVAAVKTTLIFPQLSDPIFESGSPGSRSKADPSVCHTTCRIQIPPVANISITVITSLAQPPFGTGYKLHVTSPHDTSLTLPSTMKLTDLPNDKATYGPHDQASTSNTIFQDLETIVVRAIALKLYIPRRESYVVEPDPREARLWRKKGEGNEWVGWMITYQPGRVMLDRLEDRKVTRQGEWRAATEYGEQNTRDIKEDVESEALGEKLED